MVPIIILFFNITLFMHLFLAVLGLCCFTSFHLVAANRGYSPGAVHRLLTAVASCAGRTAWALGKGSVVTVPRLWSTGSVVAVPRLWSTGSVVAVHAWA